MKLFLYDLGDKQLW